MADLFKTPGGGRTVAQNCKDTLEEVIDDLAEKKPILEDLAASKKKKDSLCKEDGNEDADDADDAYTEDDNAADGDDQHAAEADKHTASKDRGKENKYLLVKRNIKSKYPPRISSVNRKPEVIIIDDSSDDDDESFMVDESQALASLKL